ncbi:MAG: ribonuclease HII [alpha proteobacterium HIMB114]|nr:MAG: ribonuclease HII [alpha proteobacterium HIMB114]
MLSILEEKKISNFIVGVDEVGRGPLAGPVVSAAVILPLDFNYKCLNDSKKLSKTKREKVFEILKTKSKFKLGIAEVDEIDKINILQASLISMKRAVDQFDLPKDHKILVDGPWSFDKTNQKIITKIKGDAKYPSIAAASIIAKVYRDQIMSNLSKNFVQYSWDTNSGYGTQKHLKAIKEHGITVHHRKSFAPIHKILSL